jgi:regulatory protein
LALLARREHGVDELARRLVAKGCDPLLAREVADELAGEGLADDRRFAEGYAHGRAERGLGPVRIAHELRERGLPGERIREALAPYEGEWQERMERARSKQFGPAPRARDARLRQARFLDYRGFPRELVRAWLERGDSE